MSNTLIAKTEIRSGYSHLEKCKQNNAPIAKIVTPRLLQFLFFHFFWFRFCQQAQPICPSFNYGDEFKMSLQENNMIFFDVLTQGLKVEVIMT